MKIISCRQFKFKKSLAFYQFSKKKKKKHREIFLGIIIGVLTNILEYCRNFCSRILHCICPLYKDLVLSCHSKTTLVGAPQMDRVRHLLEPWAPSRAVRSGSDHDVTRVYPFHANRIHLPFNILVHVSSTKGKKDRSSLLNSSMIKHHSCVNEHKALSHH